MLCWILLIFSFQDSKIQGLICETEQRLSGANVRKSGTPVRFSGSKVKLSGTIVRSSGRYCEVFGEQVST